MYPLGEITTDNLYIFVIKIVIATSHAVSSESNLWLKFELVREKQLLS